MAETNQDLPLTQTAMVINFPFDKTLEIRQTYSAKLREVKDMSVEEVIQELAAYKAAESLKLHYSKVVEVSV